MGDTPSRAITLTLRHEDAPLADQIDRLIRSFAKLRRHTCWTAAVEAGAYFIEIKRSACGRFWHPHLHIVVKGSWLDVDDLREAWRTATGGSYVVWIELARAKEGVVSYAAKYASKPLDPSVFPAADWLDECVVALRGRRLCGTFGQWRGVELEGRSDDPGDWQRVASLDRVLEAAADGELWAMGLVSSLMPAAKLYAVLGQSAGPGGG